MSKGNYIHIYLVSRLYRRNPTAWVSMIRQLEQDRDIMRSCYAPLRAALNFEIRKPGMGQRVLEHRLKKLSRMKHCERIVKLSRGAFSVFQDKFLADLASIESDFVNGQPITNVFEFAGQKLTGGFHAKVTTVSGDVQYLYFYSSQWNEDQRTAFVELLAILGESVYGATRDQIIFVDLQTAEIVRPQRFYKRLRSELEATVSLLVRVRK